jgi:hypothetical protein
MKENLKTTKLTDYTELPFITDDAMCGKMH